MARSGVHSHQTYRERLSEGRQVGKTGLDLERYVFATTSMDDLNREEWGRLDWICRTFVWPETRRRRGGDDTANLFT